MVGKKIGVQSGGNDTIFAALLAANDLDASEITIVPVQYDPTVLTTGEVDGFMSYITNEPILLKAAGFENTAFLFADNGLPFVNETVVVAQESIDNDREKVKALLLAEIKGWTDALNDPEEGARLAVEEYGKDQNLELEEQIEEINAQADLVVTSETAQNGIFTISDELVQESLDSLAKAGVTITAEELFDLSIVNEIYEENPDLIAAVEYQPKA
jgi:ABC-type nitrate/sulfonate/bicarbonate transport system substrate-binding protein